VRKAALVVLILVVGCLGAYYAVLQREEVCIGRVVIRAQQETSVGITGLREQLVGLPGQLAEVDAASASVNNVVIVVGDGAGIGVVSVATELLPTPTEQLVYTQAESIGLLRTAAADDLVTDSAASATALACGFKTACHMVATLPDGRAVETLLEAARRHGKAVGAITNSGLVDATPAGFLTHAEHRDNTDEILEQMLDSEAELLLGGDWYDSHPDKDGQGYQELLSSIDEAARGRYTVVRSLGELARAQGPVLGLFPRRDDEEGMYGPPLGELTQWALDRLGGHEGGFVLLVEDETIDELAHDNSVTGVLAGVDEVNDAARRAISFAQARDDTLVLVLADHDTGGLAISGGKLEDGRAKIRWATHDHTCQWTPLFAFGAGARLFSGVYDNTGVAHRLGRLLGLEGFPSPVDPGVSPSQTES